MSFCNKDNKIGAINRMKDPPEQFTVCQKAVFSSDSQSIFMAHTDLHVDVFRLLIGDDTIDIDFETSFDLSKVLKGPILHFELSDCGKYLVAADVSCNITVWRQNDRNWAHHINLPKYHVSPVSIAIHKRAPKLVAAFADGKLFEYHLEEMKFLCTTLTHFVESQERYAIKNIAPDPKNEDVFVVHNDKELFVLVKETVSGCAIARFIHGNGQLSNCFCFSIGFDQSQENHKAYRKRARKSTAKNDNDDDDDDNAVATRLVCTNSLNYEHLLNITWMNDTELIAVGVNPITMIAQLPASLKEKRFGVS